MSDEELKIPQKVERVSVAALDEILGQAFPCLDKGFVRPVDYMGGDASIVRAARVSYGKGTKKISEDAGLIRYLLRHSHTTPFEMCEITFHVRVPMDCWRQWIRHRMSSTNEYSTRYSEAIDDKQETPPDQWRLQSTTNKQGSSGDTVTEWPEKDDPSFLPFKGDRTAGQYLSEREAAFHESAAALYAERLKFGVAKEVARKDLPLSTYTEAYWKIDLHNLLHFLSLRMDAHAQREIREYANAMGNIVSVWCPMAWQAFNDYNFRRHALLLSRRDKCVVNCLTQYLRKPDSTFLGDAQRQAREWGWLERDDKTGKLKANRERAECLAKLLKLSFDTTILGWNE